jgi:hypothetical protein
VLKKEKKKRRGLGWGEREEVKGKERMGEEEQEKGKERTMGKEGILGEGKKAVEKGSGEENF